MGNRAVVTVEGSKTGVYLHWNGGKESVNGFLRAAKELGVRAPTEDDSYFYARFAQIVGNFFGGTTSVGIDSLDKLDTDNYDNGTFVIGADFKILRTDHEPKHEKVAYDKGYEDKVYEETLKINRPIFERKE
jgi:hypothetical protein